MFIKLRIEKPMRTLTSYLLLNSKDFCFCANCKKNKQLSSFYLKNRPSFTNFLKLTFKQNR